MAAITVTATESGSTANGIGLRVFVLTGAAKAAAQTGGSAQQAWTSGTCTQSITTTAGSNVYGTASSNGSSGDTATGSNATVVDHVFLTAVSEWFYSWKALNVTSGATVRGLTTGAADGGPMAQLEILASGTLAEDASGPAVVTSDTAITVTTASFTPPPGSLLVALTASNGGGAQVTMTVSDSSGLLWSEKVKNNPSGGDYAGVWIADVPAAGGGVFPAAPGQTWLRAFHHRQAVLPPGPVTAVANPAGTIQPLPTRPSRRRPARGVWGGLRGATGIAGKVQLWPTIPVPRRRPARAFIQFTPVTTTNQVVTGVAVPAPVMLARFPRRRLSRAFTGVMFHPVRTVNAPPPLVPPVINPLPNGGSTEGALWEMARTGNWPKRPPGFGPVGQVPASGAVPPKPGERGWAGKKKRRFFWPREDE